MNILAINTTNKLATVVCKTKQHNKIMPLNGTYSELLMPTIDTILSDCNLPVKEIDVLGIVTGPGSFTGIRIGMAVVKGMMCACDFKCVAVNSFEVISYNIDSNNYIVLLDSGSKEPYYAIFSNKQVAEMGFGTFEKITEYAKNNNLPIYYSSAEQEVFKNMPNAICVQVSMDTLGELIEQKASNDQYCQINEILPVYIKQSQAEIGLEQDILKNCIYRNAEIADANALAVIDEQIFEGTEKYSQSSFEQELSLDGRQYFVCQHKNLVVGYVGLNRVDNNLDLLKIAVLPQYRKLGIGFKLMQMAVEYKNNNSFSQIILEVRKNNLQAIKLYKKFGFSEISVRQKYYDDGEDCLVMSKK